MSPLGAVIFYFEFVAWFMVIGAGIAIAILPFQLLYTYFTRNKY